MMQEIEEKKFIQINLVQMNIIGIMLIIIKEKKMMVNMIMRKRKNKINIIKLFWNKLKQIKKLEVKIVQIIKNIMMN